MGRKLPPSVGDSFVIAFSLLAPGALIWLAWSSLLVHELIEGKPRCRCVTVGLAVHRGIVTGWPCKSLVSPSRLNTTDARLRLLSPLLVPLQSLRTALRRTPAMACPGGGFKGHYIATILALATK